MWCFLSQLGGVSSDTKDWYKTHGGKEVRKDATQARIWKGLVRKDLQRLTNASGKT